MFDTNEDVAVYSRAQRLVPRRAVVVGCGGTGSWTALLLAMGRVEELALVDDDIVEHSNLIRVPLPPSAVGRPKVEAVADLIRSLRPSCVVITIREKFTEPEQVTRLAMLFSNAQWFECIDEGRYQRMLWKALRDIGIYCIGVHYDGYDLLTVGRKPPTSWGPDHYNEAPSWAPPPVVAAALAVYGFLTGSLMEGTERTLNLREVLRGVEQ